MKNRVGDIANVRTGLFAKPTGNGEIVYLQSKHFDENGQLVKELFPDLISDDVSERHFLSAGDVLFAAKGTKNFATVFEYHNKPAVASTSFFVIQITDNKVLPEYLAWFLNSTSTQVLLKGMALGTSIVSISKSALESLEIVIPSIGKQQLILQIAKLRSKEIAIQHQIETLKEKQIQQQIINAIK